MMSPRWAAKPPRRNMFGQAVISMAASLLFSAGTAHLAGQPAPATTATTATKAHATAAVRLPTGRDSVPIQQRIEHCQTSSRQVWLTFDDGGSAQQVDRILAVLRRDHVQAIFFPIGAWAEGNPGLIRRIAREGHLIGDHTHDHVDLAKTGDQEATWQIEHGLTHAAGSVPLLRPPFGAGAYTARLHSLATSVGLQLCTWTVDTRDWTGASAKTIIRRVRHGDAITPPVRAGGVVIMHMNGDHTGRALPGVIAAVRARGLHLHALPR
jgi:peptidoglycan/xylan/chitin deacetylase (PgdA/CDA1 family)